MQVSILPAHIHVCICNTCVPCVHRQQKISYLLKAEIQKVVSNQASTGNSTQALCKNNKQSKSLVSHQVMFISIYLFACVQHELISCSELNIESPQIVRFYPQQSCVFTLGFIVIILQYFAFLSSNTTFYHILIILPSVCTMYYQCAGQLCISVVVVNYSIQRGGNLR